MFLLFKSVGGGRVAINTGGIYQIIQEKDGESIVVLDTVGHGSNPIKDEHVAEDATGMVMAINRQLGLPVAERLIHVRGVSNIEYGIPVRYIKNVVVKSTSSFVIYWGDDNQTGGACTVSEESVDEFIRRLNALMSS